MDKATDRRRKLKGNDPERFWSKIDKAGPQSPLVPTPCWMWVGARAHGGYGVLCNWQGAATTRAHRWVYEQMVGPIPAGLHLDHLCRTPRCVNPEHLEPVTCRVNVLRGVAPAATNAKKTQCIHGHDLSGENLYVTPDGRRQCRRCLRNAERRYRMKKP